ncbi:MAG: tRNA lysidine(34) synthetase TilS [Betaproteobacteria bacterium]|jgi:tRNA(Ile)-lysidine synthase|nr:tRNA lysidine(34) synthetase TilS [Rubrivivax sp.]
MAVPPRVAVATSGGLDSTALLHCTLAQARPLGVEVWALHVHHGLMPEADAWQARVRRQALRWGARFAGERLAGAPAKGDSVEAWARQGRYAALARLAREAGCPLVLLAHHRRDQAETWLLQALRGAGAAGLSAMPRQALREGLVWARPWLEQPREAIEAYARRHRLRGVHDPSNDDPRFARGRLRGQVWPVLQAAFPSLDTVLATAARHAQSAQALAEEVAQADLAVLLHGDALRLAPWLALTPARRANALRAWLALRLGQGAPQTLVDRLLAEAPAGSAPARWPAPGAVVQRRRGELRLLPAVAAAATGPRQRPL